jgi:hypothetical protein
LSILKVSINGSKFLSQAWGCTPVIPALGILRHENGEFQVSLNYTARTCQNEKGGLKGEGEKKRKDKKV